MEDINTSTGEDSSSALNASSSNVTRTRGSNSFSPTELGVTQIADESPPQSGGGVVDALLQYLGGRTPGGSRANAQDDTLPAAASPVETPTLGHPRAMEKAVTEGRPPQQGLAERGPSENVSGGAVWISARLAPDYRRRIAAGLAPDQTRADARLRPQTRPVDAGRGLQRRTEGEIWGAGFRIQFSCRLALVYVYSVKK